MKKTYLLGLLLSLSVILVCGSHVGAYSTSDLAGTWYAHLFESHPEMGSYWLIGNFTVDNMGNITSGTYTGPDGVSIPITGGQATIDSEGNASGSFMAEGGLTGIFPYGRLDRNRNTLTNVAIGSDNTLGISVGIKGGGSFAQSDLAGEWYAYVVESDPMLGTYWVTGKFVIDDLGNFISGSYAGPDGTTVNITGGQVIIDSNGSTSGSFTAEGGLLGTFPDGKLDMTKNILSFVVIDNFGKMDFGVAVRGGGTFSQADLAGSWSVYLLESSLTSGVYWVSGDFNLDSAGNVLSGNYTLPNETTIAVTGGTASLDPDGILNASLIAEGGLTGTFPSGKMDRNKNFMSFVGLDAMGSMDLGFAVRNEDADDGQPMDEIYYPHVASNINWETEICVINTGEEILTGMIELYNNEGMFLYGRTLTLNAEGRNALIIGNEFSDPEKIGYIIISGSADTISGYTKFYREGLLRGAVPAVHEINSGDIYIPHIASNDKWWTGIGLVNTTGLAKTVTIDFNTGETEQIDILPGEHKSFTIKSLFEEVSQPEIGSAVIKGGDGLIGLELFSSEKTLSGVLLKDDSTQTLYFPHVAGTDKWWTGIVAYNPQAIDVDLTITPYTEKGVDLGTIALGIAGGEKYIGTAEKLAFPDQTAWFKIESSLPLSGFELFGTNNGNLLAGYSAVDINRQAGVFPKLEDDGWTGIAFVNTGNMTADIALTVLNNEGEVVSEENLELGAYEKLVGNPIDIFDDDISEGTYLRFSSDMEVVGFQLNGSEDGMMLDGLPGM